MRFLIKSTLVALVATLVLYGLLRAVIPTDAWLHAFLFDRSPVQWLSILMACFGLHVLSEKTRSLAKQQRHLRSAEWKSYATGDSGAARALGYVRHRISTIFTISATHSPSFSKDAAKDLADEDNQVLNESYMLPGEVVQILPLVGFFGTVWGLSKGLYNNFVLQGEDSTNSFANAIGTAFDTTLLALFLTIALSIAQSILRRSEQGMLEKLDRFIESNLLKIDATGSSPLPTSNDPRVWLDEFGIDPSELIGFLRKKLSVMAENLHGLTTTNATLLASLQELTEATRANAPQPSPDPTPQLEELAALLTRLNSAQADAGGKQQEAAQAISQLESVVKAGQATAEQNATQQVSALNNLSSQHQASATAAAEQAARRLETLNQIVSQLQAAQTQAESAHSELRQTLQDGSEALSAEVLNAARQSAEGLTDLKQLTSAQHKQTQELLKRPKSFTVTEAPSAGDAQKA